MNNPFSNMGLSIICGVPGSGKSLMTVESMVRTPGRICGNINITKYHPSVKRYKYLTMDEILNPDTMQGFWERPELAGNYTIFIDEADIVFDCMSHRALQGKLSVFLKQHRKRNIRMVFIVQAIPNLWVRIRRLTQQFIFCHKDSSGMRGYFPGFMQRFLRKSYASEKLEERSLLWTSILLEHKASTLFQWYDTNELIK